MSQIICMLNPVKTDIPLALKNMKLKFFVIYMAFNDGNTFIFSNAEAFLKNYSREKWYLEDPVLNSGNLRMHGKGFVESRKNPILESKDMYPVYQVARQHAECAIVLSSISDSPIVNPEAFHKRSVRIFENVCIDFLDLNIHKILHIKPEYNHSFIVTSTKLRSTVIKQKDLDKSFISPREKECLWHAIQGKTVKEIARDLSISPHTVEQYFSNIRQAFNCKSIIEAAVESIHRGILGNFNSYQ